MAWGVNDWKGASQNVVLGDMSSESGDGTVIGNMKYCIETLASKKPTAQLIVLLPMNTNRQWSGMREMTLADNWAFGYPYRNNQTLEDYRDAIRNCAEYYNVKVIDLEEICPINRLNLRYMCGDGLHPLGVASVRIATVATAEFDKWVKAFCNHSTHSSY